MELNILSGNMLSENSQRAVDDDMYGEVLEKYGSTSKKDKDMKILTKDNAKEACAELFGKQNNVDSFDAQDKINKQFSQVWKDHDVLNRGFIDYNEGYSLL